MELLIVIVVIAVLATIAIVAFRGVQERARDSQRKSEMAAVAKALELYYIDNGRFPAGSGSTVINSAWSTTADGSWANLLTALQPYMKTLPQDPISTPGSSVISSSSTGTNYAYFANTSGTYCGTAANQTYILVYRLEGADQENKLTGTCTVSPLGPFGGSTSSNIRVAK